MGAVSPDGRLVGDVSSSPTGREFGIETLRGSLTKLTQRMREHSTVTRSRPSVFGIAGVVGPGAVTQLTNLPLLSGVDLEALLREAAPYPVALENDARCFALAEARYGAGRGARTSAAHARDGRRLRRDRRRSPAPGRGEQAGEVWNVPLRGRHLEHFLAGAGIVRGYAGGGRRSARASTRPRSPHARVSATRRHSRRGAPSPRTWQRSAASRSAWSIPS